jgi:hypothetical protein
VSLGTHALPQQSGLVPPHVLHEPPQWVTSLATQLPPQQNWPVPHAWPHVPQLASSVMRSTHELLQHVVGGACIVQSTAQPVHSGAVAMRHTPRQHVFVPVAGHAMPAPSAVQPPQFISSDCGSTQVPPQQLWLAPQATPQPPQFISSVSVSTHDELQQVSAAPLHDVSQVPQVASVELRSTQVPLQHDVPAPHALPHIPQFASSVITSKSSSVEPSQSSSW